MTMINMLKDAVKGLAMGTAFFFIAPQIIEMMTVYASIK